MENFSYNTTTSPSLFRKVVRLIAAVALIGLVLMFSALIFLAVLTVGAMAWGYLWWKTRNLRKQMSKHPSDVGVIDGEIIRGEVIEGEVIRVVDTSYRGER